MLSKTSLHRRELLGFLCGTVVSVAACRRKTNAEPAPTRTINRVVSVTPSTTEAMFALGQGSKLVGRSRYCDYPPEVVSLPTVGGYVDLSFEAVIGLRPDLVVGARGPAGSGIVGRLAEHGIRSFFPKTESIPEILDMLRALGDLLAAKEAAADIVRRIEMRLESIRAAVLSLPKPKTLLVFGLSPIVVAGPGSFPSEMLERAGATNAMTQGTTYPTIDIETVMRLDPELVIDTSSSDGHNSDRIKAPDSVWQRVLAIRRGSVISLRDDTILRAGPRVADGIATLARAIHPNLEIRQP